MSVEVRVHSNGWVHVRDTKHPDQALLIFDADEWRNFLLGAKAGEFDAAQLHGTSESEAI